MIVCPACRIPAEKDDFLSVGEHKLICRICLSIIDEGFICPKCGHFIAICDDPHIKNSKFRITSPPILQLLGITGQRHGQCSICNKISAFSDFEKALRHANNIYHLLSKS